MNDRSNTIITSFHKDRICLKMYKGIIIIESLPLWALNDKMLIQITDINQKKIYENTFWVTLFYEFNLPPLPNGYYCLHLYYKSQTKDQYLGLNSSKGFPFQIVNGCVFTIIAKTFTQNKELFQSSINDFISSHDSSVVPCLQPIPESVIELARRIIRSSFTNYEKVLAIHDWVAENITYDYDALSSGNYRYLKNDALSILKTRKCVCVGFSELTVTLLKAVGIHAINMDCFALGYLTDGDWTKPENMCAPANHVVTFAYADDRWIMMDPTWDSDNEYRDGIYRKKSGYGVSHQFFDCTLAFFSYTHRFIR